MYNLNYYGEFRFVEGFVCGVILTIIFYNIF